MKAMLSWLLFLLVSPLAAEEGSRLEMLKQQKDAAVERAIAPIEERYRGELEQLLRILTSSNELEQALEVKKALEDPDFDEVSSERLARIRDQRADAIERAKAPIEATYVNELEKLQRHATVTGDLEEAVRIKEVLEKFQANALSPGEDHNDEGFSEKSLIGTEWVLVQGGEQVMFRFGEGRFQAHHLDVNDNWVPGGHRNWRLENARRRQIRIFWNYGEEVATVNSRMTQIKDAKHVLRRLED